MLVGRTTFLPLFSLLVASLSVSPAQADLCFRKECNCTRLESSHIAAKCLFPRRQRLEFEKANFPDSLVSVEIAGGKDVRFGQGVFSKLSRLELVRMSNMSQVYVGKGSLGNLSAAVRGGVVRFEFRDFETLVLEDGSFAPGTRPVSALVTGVKTAYVQSAAFAWLKDLTVSSVQELDLSARAFQLHNIADLQTSQEPSTNITFENVKMEALGPGTFHSPVGVVRLSGTDVKRIKADAFISMQLGSLIIENSTIHKIESEAFSSQTLIKSLKFNNVKIHEIAPRALLSGLNNLSIEHSTLGIVHSGAINVTVAAVKLSNNILKRVFKRGFNLKEWNSITVINNTFKWVDGEAFAGPFLRPAQVMNQPSPRFNFSGNSFQDVGARAFDFDLTEELAVDIENNRFNFKCHCNMRVNVREVVTGSEATKDKVFETGLCSVDRTLAQCFQLSEGWRNTMNFTEMVCEGRDQILCEEVQRDAAVPAHIPSIISSVDRISVERREREKKVLGSIFLIVLCGMLLMMAMSGFMWLRRKGYCTKARLMLLPSTNSLINLLGRMFSGGGTTPTGSISRLSVHEYAELQRKIEEGLMANGGVGEEEAPLEDKATQTLPEELTQELLQSLREKLDDPDNYKEARDMIEHLYDLIKVEESCNRNDHGDSVSVHLEELERGENVYDVIGPKRRRSEPSSKTTCKNFVSIGTRAPSPDKLLPSHGANPALVCEYIEPRDRRLHVYSELPQAPGMLCDYGEPTDTTVHVYAELPPPSISPGNKMANRPLPSKPDQVAVGKQRDHKKASGGGGPSTSSSNKEL